MMRTTSSQRVVVAAALILMVVACASSEPRRQAPPPRPSGAEVAPPPPGMAVAGQEHAPAVPECEHVLSCYEAMAGDLCLAGEEKCFATFRITAPVDKAETCTRLLDQAEETAKPFMAGKRYDLPQECS
jgi:hypothetical protein